MCRRLGGICEEADGDRGETIGREPESRRGVDIDCLNVARETGAASLGESDARFDEAVLELIDSGWKE